MRVALRQRGIDRFTQVAFSFKKMLTADASPACSKSSAPTVSVDSVRIVKKVFQVAVIESHGGDRWGAAAPAKRGGQFLQRQQVCHLCKGPNRGCGSRSFGVLRANGKRMTPFVMSSQDQERNRIVFSSSPQARSTAAGNG